MTGPRELTHAEEGAGWVAVWTAPMRSPGGPETVRVLVRPLEGMWHAEVDVWQSRSGRPYEAEGGSVHAGRGTAGLAVLEALVSMLGSEEGWELVRVEPPLPARAEPRDWRTVRMHMLRPAAGVPTPHHRVTVCGREGTTRGDHLERSGYDEMDDPIGTSIMEVTTLDDMVTCRRCLAGMARAMGRK